MQALSMATGVSSRQNRPFPTEERLRGYIHPDASSIILIRMKEIWDIFSRLYLMEMVNPTGLIQDAWQEDH